MIEVRRSRDADELAAALALREQVFCGEQGVTPEGERDGLDDEALHLVAVTRDGEVVGTCRVLLEGGAGRLGRLCVRRDHRGAGLGEALLAEAERAARGAGAERMDLHAQTAALGLYRRAGYAESGEPFMEEGIEHLTMRKRLA